MSKLTRKLIPVGYFREFGGSSDQQQRRPSITQYLSKSPQRNEDRAAVYLRTATCIGARGGVTLDVLDHDRSVAGLNSTHSDGQYVWEASLAYYVEKYHVRLPEAFLRHMESLGWTPPDDEQVYAYDYEVIPDV